MAWLNSTCGFGACCRGQVKGEKGCCGKLATIPCCMPLRTAWQGGAHTLQRNRKLPFPAPPAPTLPLLLALLPQAAPAAAAAAAAAAPAAAASLHVL